MRKLVVLLAALFTFASTAFAQLGTLNKDLVFTPVTPCRIMDTRNAGINSGILVAGSTRTFYGISSSGNYPSQGGSSPDCNIPFIDDVAALVLNFTAVTPATAGFITVFPADATQPTAATVNFTAGSVVGNNATLKLAQTGGGTFKIYTTSTLHVVGDVVGYYAKPVSVGSLECTNVSTVSASVTGLQSITSACTAGYIVTGGSCDTSNSTAKPNTGSRFNGNSWVCETNNYPGNSTPATITSTARCCRIPGR